MEYILRLRSWPGSWMIRARKLNFTILELTVNWLRSRLPFHYRLKTTTAQNLVSFKSLRAIWAKKSLT